MGPLIENEFDPTLVWNELNFSGYFKEEDIELPEPESD
jgi:hypothetical protein